LLHPIGAIPAREPNKAGPAMRLEQYQLTIDTGVENG
jgi:hypothetical protein